MFVQRRLFYAAIFVFFSQQLIFSLINAYRQGSDIFVERSFFRGEDHREQRTLKTKMEKRNTLGSFSIPVRPVFFSLFSFTTQNNNKKKVNTNLSLNGILGHRVNKPAAMQSFKDRSRCTVLFVNMSGKHVALAWRVT